MIPNCEKKNADRLVQAWGALSFEAFVGATMGINAKISTGRYHYHLGKGHTGCSLSNFTIWELFLKNFPEKEWLFLFESDAEQLFPTTNILESFQHRPDCEVAYMFSADASDYDRQGLRVRRGKRTQLDMNWHRVPNPVCTAAMAYHRGFLEEFPMDILKPIDRQINEYMIARKKKWICGDFFKHGFLGSSTIYDSGK